MKSKKSILNLDGLSSKDVDTKRRIFIFNAVSYLGALVIFLFALRHANTENSVLKYLYFSGASCIFINVVLSNFFSKKDFFLRLGSVLVIFMMLGQVYSGGYMNTGLYWVFQYAFVLFVLLGYRLGMLANCVVFVLMTYMLVNQEMIVGEFSYVESSRFLGAYFVTVLLMFAGEYYRYRSHQEMEMIQDAKERKANTDVLTGLPNRRFVDSEYIKGIGSTPEISFPLTILMVDIDYFKAINDRYGHAGGDAILMKFADVLNANCRKSDIVARTGGEEFIFMFPGTPIEQGRLLAEKIRHAIEVTEFHVTPKKSISITASFGVSATSSLAFLHQSIKDADSKLYEAKRDGRNCVR